ncbi:chemotaxis protein CheB [Paraglaciecola sp. MB-3u-78]|uniref:chemotaxis protein CheB n=1 Tax=Paraglaciecola sp. MB-3u-78 TaxID=2058332 RepID=UPI001E589E50|nr:chemotaxis protein CheB [Paraglaciecola sp. MB-3u-78]
MMAVKKTSNRSLNKTDKVSPKVSSEAKDHEKVSNLEADPFYVVGIGASAGGLKAFQDFFSGIPDTSNLNMAFVLVQHLAPDHKSILSDLIRRYTSMQVFEVEDCMEVHSKCIYIIPPKYDMAFINGKLQLLTPVAPHGQRLAIDFFFRSLAHDQRERAIGLVLSGTGSDGTLGVRAIKGEGGMVMVQTPSTAEFDGMPLSAIATGMVDYELSPAKMGNRLIAYTSHFNKTSDVSFLSHQMQTDSSLNQIFILIRDQTGHDFSQYKPSTINRRIERRLAVHQISDIKNYVQFLQHTPLEIQALFYDLLIGVTHFFRDPETFKSLERDIIPGLLKERDTDKVIRIWSVGCSTGEEAYSIAILLRERMEKIKQEYKVQLFATDIDGRAIITARSGLYPASIVNDISSERLGRFFTSEPDGSAYRINKVVRDMLIFSEQDVIKDPPFSRLDLLICRNLLIYLNTTLQEKLINLFHYALNPLGVLMLGTSEGIGKGEMLFELLNRNSKLFRRKVDFPGMTIMSFSGFRSKNMGSLSHGTASSIKSGLSCPLSFRELTEMTLINKLSPAGVLIRANGDILYLHGQSGMFLSLNPGNVIINNVLKMARPGLKNELKSVLYNAIKSKNIERHSNVKIKSNKHFEYFNLIICPIKVDSELSNDKYLYLMVMENRLLEQKPEDVAKIETNVTDSKLKRLVLDLQEELKKKDEYLQNTQEQLDASNEELKSSNEEMQSINEELQSTNEELETSKEELQSINEELSTVNSELQTKVRDLSISNNDMNNLLAGTNIATVFVDHKLRIMRFTPTAHTILNLITGDVGRPVGHIVSNLVDYSSLVTDIQQVLNTLQPKETEVQTPNGKRFNMSIQPYRTLDNVIEGAVISFIDITEVKQIKGKLQESESRFHTIFDNVPFGVAYHEMIYDSSGKAVDYRFLGSNESYRVLIGIDPLGKTMRELDLGTEKDNFDWIGTFEHVVKTGEKVQFETLIQPSNCWCECMAFRDAPQHFVAVFNNVTDRKQAEDALCEKKRELQQLKLASPSIKN